MRITIGATALVALVACGETDRRQASASRRGTGDGGITAKSDGSPGVDASQVAGDGGTPIVPDTGVPPAPGSLVRGLEITEVSVYQGVKIAIARNGTAVSQRNAPVVAGRPALIRVSTRPQPEWTNREVVARLRFESSNVADQEARRVPTAASTDNAPDSTFNFLLQAGDITAGMRFSVALEEVSGNVNAGGNTNYARYPANGTAPMDAEDSGTSVQIVLVPVQYNFDGTGRLPDTSAAQVARYRDGMFGMFPTREVDITVHAPVAWDDEIQPFGQGWGDLLQGILNLRRSDRVRTNVYYYGLFAPAESFARFCGRGCVAGLSTLSGNPNDDYVRGSIGLGFTGDDSVGTFIHEVGHAHGRQHAPCGLGGQSSDPAYPYSGAQLGVWGYDIVSRRLLSPTQHKDVMSYCDPRWISDYQYGELFDRIAYVNSIAHVIAPSGPRNWRVALVDTQGAVKWGDPVETLTPPGGEPQPVLLEDARGRIVGQADAYFYPYSHIPGGMWFMPESVADRAKAVTLPSGARLPL